MTTSTLSQGPDRALRCPCTVGQPFVHSAAALTDDNLARYYIMRLSQVVQEAGLFFKGQKPCSTVSIIDERCGLPYRYDIVPAATARSLPSPRRRAPAVLHRLGASIKTVLDASNPREPRRGTTSTTTFSEKIFLLLQTRRLVLMLAPQYRADPGIKVSKMRVLGVPLHGRTQPLTPVGRVAVSQAWRSRNYHVAGSSRATAGPRLGAVSYPGGRATRPVGR